jgi:hypothetical protein
MTTLMGFTGLMSCEVELYDLNRLTYKECWSLILAISNRLFSAMFPFFRGKTFSFTKLTVVLEMERVGFVHSGFGN